MIVSGADLVNVVERFVDDYDPRAIGVISLDVRLGDGLLVGVPGVSRISIDENGKPIYHGFTEEKHEIGDIVTLLPGCFYLAHTIEYFRMPSHLAGKLFLRSTSGRSALDHMHAGLLEPGWHGQITMELSPVVETQFRVGDRIAQITFELVSQPVSYDGNYNGQRGPTVAAGGVVAVRVGGAA